MTEFLVGMVVGGCIAAVPTYIFGLVTGAKDGWSAAQLRASQLYCDCDFVGENVDVDYIRG